MNHQETQPRNETAERHKGRAKEMLRRGEKKDPGSRQPGEFASRLRERVEAAKQRRARGGDHAGL